MLTIYLLIGCLLSLLLLWKDPKGRMYISEGETCTAIMLVLVFVASWPMVMAAAIVSQSKK